MKHVSVTYIRVKSQDGVLYKATKACGTNPLELRLVSHHRLAIDTL